MAGHSAADPGRLASTDPGLRARVLANAAYFREHAAELGMTSVSVEL